MWCKECNCLICAACGYCKEHQGHSVKFIEEVHDDLQKEVETFINTTASFHEKAMKNVQNLGEAISVMEKV